MKPRTQAELDALYAEYPGLEASMELADYVDAGVEAWCRRYDPAHISGRYDNYDANDAKHAAMFPRAEYTVTVRGKPK
jgi:hypothetical protein